ncbi:MAG: TonB-dependent receptor plug domain-containing protein [Desulfosalsimonas sp.]
MKVKFVCLACLLGILLSWPASAQQEAEEEDSVISLDEVVVTGQRIKEPVREVDASVTLLEEEEIRISSAKDLGDLLAEENIGHIQKQPGNLTSIGIRGFRGDTTGNDLQGNVLILLNGRRAGTGNVAKIMTENIERIEIIRGPASVQYGSAAIGGVVNVITKQGTDEPSFFAEGELGSFGYEGTRAGFSGKSNSFDFSGAVSRSTRDDYYTADGDKYENTGYDEKQNISLNLGYEFMPENRIGIIYTSFDADHVGSPYYFSAGTPEAHVDNLNESVDFVYDGAAEDGLFSWKARYFTGTDEYNYYDPEIPSVSETETDSQGAQAQVTWDPGQYTVTAGADWINYEIEQDSDPNKTEYDNPSYFFLGKARYFDDRLSLSGGLRYDDYEIKVKQGEGSTNKDDNISPKIGVSWFILNDLKIRANYAQGFRMPSVSELHTDYTTGEHFTGNPGLKPEKSDNYELGLNWYHKVFDASLTYFYTDFKDKIEWAAADAPNTVTYKNIGEAAVSGFEGRFSHDLATWWNLDWEIKPYVNFTYLTEYENEETGEDLKYASDLLISYGVSISDYDGFSARLNIAHTGEQYVDDWVNYDGTKAEPEVVEKGKFSTANLTVEKRLVDFNSVGDLALRGEIDNLFNRDYSYVKGYPMPGRNFALSLKYTY